MGYFAFVINQNEYTLLKNGGEIAVKTLLGPFVKNGADLTLLITQEDGENIKDFGIVTGTSQHCLIISLKVK